MWLRKPRARRDKRCELKFDTYRQGAIHPHMLRHACGFKLLSAVASTDSMTLAASKLRSMSGKRFYFRYEVSDGVRHASMPACDGLHILHQVK